jgi:hypothetical protein
MSKIAESDFPKVFANDLLRPFQVFFGGVENASQSIMEFMAILGALANILPAMAARIGQSLKDIADPNKTPLQRLGAAGRLGMEMLPSGQMAAIGYQFEQDRRKNLAAMNRRSSTANVIDESQRTKPFGAAGKMPEEDAKSKHHKKTVEHHLQRISNNTRKSADLLDLRNQTIGGGRLASLGITGAEIASAGGRVRNELSKAKPISADSMVTRGIKQMIQNNMGFAVNGGRTVPVR